jgi:hypothetical protein
MRASHVPPPSESDLGVSCITVPVAFFQRAKRRHFRVKAATEPTKAQPPTIPMIWRVVALMTAGSLSRWVQGDKIAPNPNKMALQAITLTLSKAKILWQT